LFLGFILNYWLFSVNIIFFSILPLLRESQANVGNFTTKYFTIHIVDDVTGRGVPLVSFTTTSRLQYWSDSNGIVAFYEPGLMNQTVWFDV
jgi:hypothetical protein